jgi:hypothetical protein
MDTRPMEARTAVLLRRRGGAICLMLFFPALIGATLADPLDDSAAQPAQLRQAAGHLGQLHLTFLLELVGALLFVGASMGLVGAIRRRGAGWANAAGVAAAFGAVGMSLISMAHLYLYALAASGTADGAGVLAARDSVAGWIVPLFFAAPLAVVLLGVAAFRAGFARWPMLVVVGVFAVLEIVPTPLGELPALIAGLVAFCWLAIALWGVPGQVSGAREPARRDSTTVQA